MATSGWSFPPSAFADQIDEEVETRVRTISLALLREVIERSPVGNPDLWEDPPPPGYVGGRFRGSHIVSIGSPVYTVTTEVDPSGSGTMSRGMAVLTGLEPYTQVFIQTNLPYAESLELGHSSQAPEGMYGLAFISVSEVYR